MINGITNFRNREKIEDTVTKIRTKTSGNTNPMIAPATIPIINLEIRPSPFFSVDMKKSSLKNDIKIAVKHNLFIIIQ